MVVDSWLFLGNSGQWLFRDSPTRSRTKVSASFQKGHTLDHRNCEEGAGLFFH